MSGEKYPFFDMPEDDVSPLFTTRLQEAARVGCLRGVFDGGGIKMDWIKGNEALRSPAFDEELRDLIETFRHTGPLKNFQSMRQFCLGHPRARMSGRQTFYAFRIDTQRYRYHLRFFPQKGKFHIEFAWQKAKEVFQTGDIPICPHLMFPPFADPGNPTQDQAAREMGLHLVESCQQVNVYGTVLSEGMWAEINHAVLLGIPVISDSVTIGRSLPRRQVSRKERGDR